MIKYNWFGNKSEHQRFNRIVSCIFRKDDNMSYFYSEYWWKLFRHIPKGDELIYLWKLLQAFIVHYIF